MAGGNEVEIVVKSKDKTGAGYDEAKKRARKFGKEVETEVSASGERAGKGFGDAIGGQFSDFGGALGIAGLGIGGVAGAALVQGFTDAMDIEAANDKLTAQLGLTEQESQRVGGVAGALFADAYGDSLADVNAAIKGVANNITDLGDVSEDELTRMAAHAMDLATVMDEDVGEVTRAVGKMLKTGLAKDADEAFDILTRGVQTGADEAQDLLDTFGEYSTQFRKLGLDGTTAMGLISQGLQAGARDADIVADAFKEFSIRAVDGSELTAESFKRLGLNAKEMQDQIAKGGRPAAEGLDTVLDRLRKVEDPATRAQIAVGLFGTQAEDLGDALFALDPSNAVKTMGDVEGAATRMGDSLNDNAGAKVEAFKRDAMGKLTEFLGTIAIPAIEDTVSAFDDLGDSSDDANDSVAESAAGITSSVVVMDSNVQATVGAMVVKLAGKFESMKASAIAKAGTTVSGVATRWSNLPARVSASLGGLATRVATRFENAKSRALAIVGTLGSQLFAAGGRIIQRLVDGIQARAAAVAVAIAGIAATIRANLPFSPAREGPLSGQGDPLISGGKIAERLAAGITSRRQRVAGAMGGVLGGGVAAPAALAVPAAAAIGGGVAIGGSGPLVLRIDSAGSRLDDLLVELLRKAVRARGGDVQVVLGT